MHVTIPAPPVKRRLERPAGRSKRKRKIKFPLKTARAKRRPVQINLLLVTHCTVGGVSYDKK